MIHDWTRQSIKEVNEGVFDNKQRDRAVAKLENSKAEASITLAKWAELTIVGDQFRWTCVASCDDESTIYCLVSINSDLQDLDAALRQLHQKPDNVKPLLAPNDAYSFQEVARALLREVWPSVAVGDDIVQGLPKVKGEFWVKSLQPLGPGFGIGTRT